MRSGSACISVRIPENFRPCTSKSFGQRISGAASSSSAAASRAAKPRHQSQQRSMRRRNRRAQQHRAVNSRGFLRNPFPSRAPAPRRLFFGQHHGAVRLALLAQLHRHGIRRINFEKMINPPRKRRAVQPVTQQLRRQNIRRPLDVIARSPRAPSRARPLRAASPSNATPAAASRQFPSRSSLR